MCIYSDNKCLNLCQDIKFLKQVFNLKSFYNLLETKEIIQKLEILENDNLNQEDEFLKKKWKNCDKTCFNQLFKLIDNEINSTAYMLRLLSNSIISTENLGLELEYDNQGLTGFWDKDYQRFSVRKLGDNKTNRLIFGFGPSASGKTYWAENIIKLFSLSDSEFPKTFISIDGGLYRELSETYQFIINNLSKNNIGGFLNLVTAGFGGSKSLFSSSLIKKSMIKFLKTQENISLYVPITLGGCYKNWCISDYKPYINIVNDQRWIGFNFSDISGLECPYRDKYRCVGCTESGKNRETLIKEKI